MKPPNDFEKTIKNASLDTNEATDKRILTKMHDAYENGCHAYASVSVPSDRHRVPRWATAAIILIAVGVFLGHWADFGSGNVAWADVAARFQTVPFFSATIYQKNDATAEPTQMELWMNHDGYIRLRIGKQIVFARGGRIVAYETTSRRTVEPDAMARAFIERISLAGEFSLEAIIEVMFGGEATDVTPLVNPDAVISRDMVVFDVELPHTPEWVRIWALRESRLPARIRVWDPRDGACTDAVFEYSKEQRAEFFDPNAFGALLQGRDVVSGANTVYAFLQDPGGRNVTPEEMFEKSGYHLPVVKRAGMTEDGAFWVLADKGLNQRASGSVFFGFARIADDLGRMYVRSVNGYHGTDDVSLDVFVPLDFPFDRRRPSRITLVCSPRQTLVSNVPDEIVGTVELTAWEPNAPCPRLYEGLSADALRLEMDLARHLLAQGDTERLGRLLDAMPGWDTEPRNVSLLLFWQEVTCRQKNFQETLKIGQVLAPLLFEEPERTSRYHFRDFIIALAATGQLDDAKKLYERIDAIDNMSPEKSDERYYGTYLRMTIGALARDAELTIEQIGGILGFDISADATYKLAAEQGRWNAVARKRNEKAGQRLREIAAYYQSRPLPKTAELLERGDDRQIHMTSTNNRVPGHEGYKVLPINYAIRGVVSNLRAIGAETSEASKLYPHRAALRFADGLQDRELRADLVYKAPMELAERFHQVLAACGMELTTETLPAQTVFVARHDGRELKRHRDVYGPWHTDDGNSGIRTWRLADLLEKLAEQMQPGVFILDQTGLDTPLCLGDGDPGWQGPEGVAQARRWLKGQFGITLAEEKREVTTYLIQRKTP